MAPKRQVEKVEAKQVLTAVLLADSFTQVRPLAADCRFERGLPARAAQPGVLLGRCTI
jgi:hypothetical protein